MTIDTSKEAVERMANAARSAEYRQFPHGVFADTFDALAAERDAQAARADAAEAEVARLTAVLDKVSNDLMHADMRRITAETELSALRAGQDALVAAAYVDAGAVAADRCAAYGAREIARLVKEHVIRRTTADATAAMNAKLRAERNKARRAIVDRIKLQEASYTRRRDKHEPLAPSCSNMWDVIEFGREAAENLAATVFNMIEPEGK